MTRSLIIFSLILLRCCWGPSNFQLMMHQQNDDTLLKELNDTYHINELYNEDVSSFKLNMTFNDSTKQVSGFSGCNRFFGSYSLANNMVQFSALGSTKMLCNEASNTIEENILKAFKDANLILFNEGGFSMYNKKKLLLTATRQVTKQPESLEYSAYSRGIHKHIIVNENIISEVNQKGGSSTKKNCSKEDWERIINALQPIEIEDIAELKAPSKAFQYDGAALAHLKIMYDGKTFESTPFDHGNPPEELAELVKVILSISENIE